LARRRSALELANVFANPHEAKPKRNEELDATGVSVDHPWPLLIQEGELLPC